jgi:hypothetical protein
MTTHPTDHEGRTVTATDPHLHTTISDKRGTRTVRHTWRVGKDDLTEVVPAVLADFADGYGQDKCLTDAAGRTLAVILTIDEYEDGVNASAALNELAMSDSPELSDRYQPFVHSPASSVERMLPATRTEEAIARAMGKTLGDLDQDERLRVHILAIDAVLHTPLDTDSEGYVPVVAVSGGASDTEYRWTLAKRTSNPGLFKRPGVGTFGSDWAVVTGSGWKVAEFWDEAGADLCVENLHTLLPGVDWMVLGRGLTSEITAAGIRAITAAREGERITAETAEAPTA